MQATKQEINVMFDSAVYALLNYLKEKDLYPYLFNSTYLLFYPSQFVCPDDGELEFLDTQRILKDGMLIGKLKEFFNGLDYSPELKMILTTKDGGKIYFEELERGYEL